MAAESSPPRRARPAGLFLFQSAGARRNQQQPAVEEEEDQSPVRKVQLSHFLSSEEKNSSHFSIGRLVEGRRGQLNRRLSKKRIGRHLMASC